MIIKPQIIRKGTKYEGYRITLPKAIIESMGWTACVFRLELRRDRLVLIPIRMATWSASDKDKLYSFCHRCIYFWCLLWFF